MILFIDEIHTIVGAGSAAGSMDAANMLKPALARGEIQCIGATTLDEYRKNIEKDGALERRFQKVMVEPTTAGETLQILRNIKDKYEDHHNVYYTDEALEACVKLTDRYITDRNFPDKAIDALDEAGSRVHLTNINVPKEIEEQEKLIEEAKSKKNEAVKQLEKITGKTIFLTVVEVKQAESDKDARIVSRKMAEDLENRASFRRVQKMAIQKALKAGAKGIKTMVSGRLGGAEIARSEWYSEGSVPLHTFRANIDYATAEAATTYGKLGVKVWINKGEVLPEAKKTVPSKEDK